MMILTTPTKHTQYKNYFMEQPKQSFDGVTDRIKDYVRLRVEIVKLKVMEKVIATVSGVIAFIIIGIFTFIFLLSAFFTLGFYLAELTGSNVAGFGLLSLILLVIVTILFFVKHKLIIQPLQSKFIVNIFKNW